jgi:hypothetical protein
MAKTTTKKAAPKNPDATATIQTRKDHDDGFTRTALVLDKGGPSVDLVTPDGRRVAQINISYSVSKEDGGEEYLIVDVIDVDKRFPQRRALHFTDQTRHCADLGPDANLVSTDFRRKL